MRRERGLQACLGSALRLKGLLALPHGEGCISETKKVSLKPWKGLIHRGCQGQRRSMWFRHEGGCGGKQLGVDMQKCLG